jgi:hypothetical protein
VEEKPTVKVALAAPAGEKLKGTAPETETEKAPEVKIKETPKSETAVRVAAATGEASPALGKQNVVATETQQATEAKVQENIIATKPVVEAASPDEAGEKLSAVTPESVTAEASEVVSKKVPNESFAKEALAAGAAPTVSQDRTIETPQLGQTSEVKTKETVALGKSPVEAAPETEKEAVPEAKGKEPEVATGISATSGKAVETAATPSVEVSSVSGEVSSAPEKETPSADAVKEVSAEPDTEQALVASKGNILEKEDPAKRLRTFLNTYCQAYESKNLDKFFTFFAPDASENNRPFNELMPKYRENMEMIDSFKYRIEILAYSTQADTGNVRVQGKFFTQYLLHGGSWKDNSGNISMELAEHGDSFLVKQLNYGK